jgi:hypothetical protein
MPRRSAPAPSALRIACILFIVGALVPEATRAVTRLEGYYQTQLDIRKQDRSYQWDFDANSGDGSDWNYLELRLLAQPRPNTEAFLKTYAQWNPFLSNDRRPTFLFQEGHIKYRLERGARAYEAIAFSRERRFWVDNHLIGLVYEDAASGGGNAAGLRLETWGPRGFNAVYVLDDFSNQSTPDRGALPNAPVPTDDAHILRARRNFLSADRLRLGVTEVHVVRVPQPYAFLTSVTDTAGVARLVTVQRDTSSYVNVLGVDTRFTIGTTDIAIEYAQTAKPEFAYARAVTSDSLYRDPPAGLDLSRLDEGLWRALPSTAVLRAEIRSLRVGTPRLGYLSIAPSYRILGRQWDDPIGEGTRDEVGYFINSWYLIPQRAITVTGNYGHYRKRFDENACWTDRYGEMYTEYVNGFTSKFAYRDRDGFTGPLGLEGCHDLEASVLSYHQDTREFFAEVTAQSSLAWARLQFKARRVVEGFRLMHQQLYALESSVNLSPSVKVYTRLTFGNDATRTRTGTFTELQFRPYSNMEMFLSYGPWWIGDTPNPVDDGDLAGSAVNRDIVKATLRGWF